MSPAAVAVSLKKLEKAGYIERQCVENDNRVNHIIVTEKGKRTIDISIRYFKEMDIAFFEGFSMEEMEQMESFLWRMIKNGESYHQKLISEERLVQK